MKYQGYAGKILRVDLSNNKVTMENVDETLVRQYLGGNGFGIKYLYEEVPAGLNPLDPTNRLIIMSGPGEGTMLPGAGRAVVITKSPLTNHFIDSYFGGHFGAELKYAGYDGIIIQGKADKPVYLLIDDDKVTIEDASDLWGLNTFQTQFKLREKLGEDISTLAIGPAGERMVPLACIISGVSAAGRGGTGAVMGSKNLKAIAARGTQDVAVADIEGFKQYVKSVVERIKAHPGTGKNLPAYGTTASIKTNHDLGILGTRNWQQEQFEGAIAINGTTIKEKGYGIGSITCVACPIACSQLTLVNQGIYKGALTIGPEYETLFALGSTCGNANVESIVRGDQMCDEYGLDTISVGAVIAFAMECYENGIIGKEETGGIELNFGNHEAIISLIEKIACQEGMGKILGHGAKRAAEYFGRGAERFAIHVKGLEVPAHSSRGLPGMAIGYATSNRGGSHQDGRATGERTGQVDRDVIEGKGRYAANVQRMTALCDSIITCRMTENIYGLIGITDDHVQMVRLITGMDLNKEELVDIADRIYTLERVFNIREGDESRKTDTLPARFMEEPIPGGPSAGKVITPEILNKLLDEYYEERGWDKNTGYPTAQTLKRLGLEQVIKDIYPLR
ncbi:MAG: aldehyde ferredoxin oxidoreductase family protein [Bacillota bacterium]